MDQMQSPTHPLQQQQKQQQQPEASSSSPQDVLAEARKNLQLLIDSGLSRDVLHQLLDDGQSQHTQLAVPLPSSILHSQQLPQIQLQLQAQNQPQPQIQSDQTQPQPQGQTPSPAQPGNFIPPVPQCPPPPIPVQQKSPQQQQQQQSPEQQPQSSFLSPPMAKPPTPSVASSPVDIKHEPQPHMTDDAALFLQLGAPFNHRPRISVSSTSSGSSGHASIWSNASAQSSMSWASTGSNSSRMQAPLPMPPSLHSPTGSTPLMNGGQVGASGAASKQNIYWCTSCETSFKRKYDWKRHEDEFHERWRKYPCPEPGCNRSFWGSNSFNQHHKQCHGCKTCPHAEKVVRFLRKRKYWACGFCSALHPARERHVEHVARHFESGMTKGEWMHSRVIYGLLHQPLIHEAWEALVSSKQPSYGGRRARFSWHPSRTGRAQGFLEKENPGQLQDLLEFFSSDEGDTSWIVNVAYDLADIIFENNAAAGSQLPDAGNAMAPQPYPSPDPRMSFASMSAPPQQQQATMLPSSDNNAPNPFVTPTYRTPMLVPSQSFSNGAGPSPPESTSQSPLTSTHSPITPSHPPVIKQEVQTQQHPMAQTPVGDGSEGMMDFEYSPAPVIFVSWEPMSDGPVDQNGQQQPHQVIMPGPAPGWGMLQYYDPRVTS